jgi:hypothetical protein
MRNGSDRFFESRRWIKTRPASKPAAQGWPKTQQRQVYARIDALPSRAPLFGDTVHLTVTPENTR